MIAGYIKFSQSFMDGEFQYKRLNNFYLNLSSSRNFINVSRPGYTNIYEFLRKCRSSPSLLFYHFIRILPLLNPLRFFWLMRSTGLAAYYLLFKNIGFQYFIFWLFIWVNSMNKYGGIKNSDFDIENVGADYDVRKIIPINYLASADEKIPISKTKAQVKSTISQLERVIAGRLR